MKQLKIQTMEMCKCEACGQLHPIADCEYLIIKVVKGKGCQMGSIFSPSTAVVTHSASPSAPSQPQFPTNSETDKSKLPNDIVGAVNPEASKMPKRRNIVPPQLAGVFKQPDTPGAAQETRRV